MGQPDILGAGRLCVEAGAMLEDDSVKEKGSASVGKKPMTIKAAGGAIGRGDRVRVFTHKIGQFANF